MCCQMRLRSYCYSHFHNHLKHQNNCSFTFFIWFHTKHQFFMRYNIKPPERSTCIYPWGRKNTNNIIVPWLSKVKFTDLITSEFWFLKLISASNYFSICNFLLVRGIWRKWNLNFNGNWLSLGSGLPKSQVDMVGIAD